MIRAIQSTIAASGLASLDRCSENVRVLPVVIAELEFGDIQRQVFLADLVEGSDVPLGQLT